MGNRQHTQIHTAWPHSPMSRLCQWRVATVTLPGAEVVTVLVWGCPDRGAYRPLLPGPPAAKTAWGIAGQMQRVPPQVAGSGADTCRRACRRLRQEHRQEQLGRTGMTVGPAQHSPTNIPMGDKMGG